MTDGKIESAHTEILPVPKIMSKNQQIVYKYICEHPKCTSAEISESIGMKSVTARVSELVKMGYVRRLDETKTTTHGHKAKCLTAATMTNEQLVIDAIRNLEEPTNDRIAEYTGMKGWKVGCVVAGLVKKGKIEHVGQHIDENHRFHNVWGIA